MILIQPSSVISSVLTIHFLLSVLPTSFATVTTPSELVVDPQPLIKSERPEPELRTRSDKISLHYDSDLDPIFELAIQHAHSNFTDEGPSARSEALWDNTSGGPPRMARWHSSSRARSMQTRPKPRRTLPVPSQDLSHHFKVQMAELMRKAQFSSRQLPRVVSITR